MELKRNLKKLLKKYNLIEDVIIFGSFLKGRDKPKDIDLAFIVKEKNLELIPLIKKNLGIDNVHLEFINIKDIYSTKLFLNLLNEGYSVKYNKFLRDILNIHPMKMYTYDLKHLNKSKKTLFGIALKKNLRRINGEKIGIGSVLIPINQTSYFEDFLEIWGLKYKTKEWTVF